MYKDNKTGRLKSTHGMSYHRLYGVWASMISRCYNPKNKAYENYGGRGITICKKWLDVRVFIADMYPTFRDGLTIDRINNNKGYYKENCRWADRYTQAQNRRQEGGAYGIYGISFRRDVNKYRVYICRYKKMYNLGLFDTLDEAVSIREKANNSTKKDLVSMSCKVGKGEVLQIKDGKIIAYYKNQAHAAKVTGIRHAYISACLTGRQLTTKGYEWKYKDDK